MTNNELALDFAREVMGWEDAVQHEDGDIISAHWSKKEHLPFYPGSIYGDGAIIYPTAEWCDEHGFEFDIQYRGPLCWLARVTTTILPDNDEDIEIETVHSEKYGDSFDEALMKACLEAERKRRGDE